jgi:bacillithiol biosynthesis cysteine-adding enzyme BshC
MLSGCTSASIPPAVASLIEPAHEESESPKVNNLPSADCYPMTVMPGMSRLFLDYCAGTAAAQAFFAPDSLTQSWQQRPALPAHWPELVKLLSAQNPGNAGALAALATGAGTVVTGQQVGLFGGTLFTPFKAAAAIARARQATAAGHPHVAIFWLATEDHDFAEIDHVTFPTGRTLEKLQYAQGDEMAAARPVGRIVIDERITPLVDRALEILGPSDASDALAAAWKPGRTFAEAFADFYAKIFAAQGLLVLDASGREFHRLGAPVLRAGIERADELHAALLDRNSQLEAAGYHAQVAVTAQSSLLFLIDEHTGARVALKRTAASAAEPQGLWQAGLQTYSTADLVAILDAEPERVSPSALLRPVFQDFLLSNSLIVGGPAEIAYLAQSGPLYERILGRQTPAEPRMFATLIEPSVAKLLERHELSLEQVFQENAASLAQHLAARSMPIETKQKLAAAANALDTELTTLVEWMQAQDKGLGQSAETAAGKIHYQMNRMRTLAANFQLQKEASLMRHAETICQALFPEEVLQERVHGAAYYLARHGLELAETLSAEAANRCAGHRGLWL